MTEVSFHFNAPDRLGYACRLLRKAYSKGAQVQVLADWSLATELDRALWTMASTAFVPHAMSDGAPSVLRCSPIVIGTAVTPPSAPSLVLVNLCDEMPEGVENFARVIEVVTGETRVRELARDRWKRYKSAGMEPQHLDVSNVDARH